MTVCFFFALELGPAPLPAKPPARVHLLTSEEVYAQALRQIDVDHDGRVTLRDFLVYGTAHDFLVADRNADGVLDVNELAWALREFSATAHR